MGLKPDHWIEHMARNHAMITPFVDHQDYAHGLSYGLGPCGYDIRTTSEWMVASSTASWGFRHYRDLNMLEIAPGDCVLACSVETFNMPNDVVGQCIGKSSLARHFIHVLVTPLEPGWRGQLTIEIVNLSPASFTLHAGMPIAQLQFTQLDSMPTNPYDGKYNDQVGVTMARGNEVNA